jgi:hypothetical protein
VCVVGLVVELRAVCSRMERDIRVHVRVLSRTESREMRGDMNTLQVTLNTIKCIVLKTKVDTMWFKSFSTITS